MNTAAGYSRRCPFTEFDETSRRRRAVQGAGLLEVMEKVTEGVLLGVGPGYCCIEEFLSTTTSHHSGVRRHRFAQQLGLLRMRARSHVSHSGKRTIPFTLNAAYEEDTGKDTAVVLPLVAQLPNGTTSGSVQVECFKN